MNIKCQHSSCTASAHANSPCEDEMKWNEMKWNEMRWDEMRWDEIWSSSQIPKFLKKMIKFLLVASFPQLVSPFNIRRMLCFVLTAKFPTRSTMLGPVKILPSLLNDNKFWMCMFPKTLSPSASPGLQETLLRPIVWWHSWCGFGHTGSNSAGASPMLPGRCAALRPAVPISSWWWKNWLKNAVCLLNSF